MLGTGQNSRNLPSKFRSVLRLAGWNALWLIAGLVLVALIGEAWLRSTAPFSTTYAPQVFVPGVGIKRPPDTEIRSTNGLSPCENCSLNSLSLQSEDEY